MPDWYLWSGYHPWCDQHYYEILCFVSVVQLGHSYNVVPLFQAAIYFNSLRINLKHALQESITENTWLPLFISCQRFKSCYGVLSRKLWHQLVNLTAHCCFRYGGDELRAEGGAAGAGGKHQQLLGHWGTIWTHQSQKQRHSVWVNIWNQPMLMLLNEQNPDDSLDPLT